MIQISLEMNICLCEPLWGFAQHYVTIPHGIHKESLEFLKDSKMRSLRNEILMTSMREVPQFPEEFEEILMRPL